MTARVPSFSSFLHERRPPSAVGPDAPPRTEGAGDLVTALREELAQGRSPEDQARLLSEIAELEQWRGRGAEAARALVEATELDPAALAPLRGLLALALRRDALETLGPLLERLALVAATPEEKQQAYLLQFELERRRGKQEPARAVLERWLADFPDDGTAWLALDLLAGQAGDSPLQERARTGRAGAAHDPRWRALLLLQCAALRAAAQDPDTALDLCRQAADESPSLSVLVTWERTAVALGRFAEASEVAERVAASVLDASSEDDTTRDDAHRWQKAPAFGAVFALRAAEWARRAGDDARAARLLDALTTRFPDEPLPRVARVLLARTGPGGVERRETLRAALDAKSTGPVAAALALELFDLERLDDLDSAERALRSALDADPQSLAVRARHLGLRELRGAGAAYADALASAASSLGTAQADWLLSAALVALAAEPGPTPPSKRRGIIEGYLAAAEAAGAEPRLLARLRTLVAHRLEAPSGAGAPPSGGPASHEDAFDRFLSQFAHRSTDDAQPRDPSQVASGQRFSPEGLLGATLRSWLCAEAPTALPSAQDAHTWTRALRDAGAPAEVLRAATLVEARRSLAAGNEGAALERLEESLQRDPSDVTAAAALAGRLSDPSAAAEVLATAARAQEDPTRRGGWLLYASRLLWQAQKPHEALALAEEAARDVPAAARPWLFWGAHATGDASSTIERQRLPGEGDRGIFEVLEGLLRARHATAASAEPPSSGSAAEDADSPSVRWLTALLGAASSQPQTSSRRLDELPQAPVGLDALFAHAAALAPGRDLPGETPERDLAQVVETARRWAEAATSSPEGLDAALAWLVASRLAQSTDQEIEARAHLEARLGAPEFRASAALLAWLTAAPEAPRHRRELLDAVGHEPSDAGVDRMLTWAALELAPPNRDLAERAAVLEQLARSKASLPADAGGEVATTSTLLVLAGFNRLKGGDVALATEHFRRATDLAPEDVSGWEGLRLAAAQSDDPRLEAEACTELARRVADNALAAALWERAGRLHQDRLEDAGRAEEAFGAALARDPTRQLAFERLYLLARGRGDDDRLLELLEVRMGAVDNPRQLNELLWEKGRLCRRVRDEAAALQTLGQLLERDPDHLGALAMMSELCVRGRHARRAAGYLARIAAHPGAPERQRLLSGLAAADLYGQRLNAPDQALEVLQGLAETGFVTETVLERLAFAALRVGAWEVAADSLERLLTMNVPAEGRTAAEEFLLALYRDRLDSPTRAREIARLLLEEHPTHPDALASLLEEPEREGYVELFERALDELREEALRGSLPVERITLLARLAQELGWQRTALAAHGWLHLLGALDVGEWEALARWADGLPWIPRSGTPPLSPADLQSIASARDTGPFAELARELCRRCPQLFPSTPREQDAEHWQEAPPSELLRQIQGWAATLGIEELALRRHAQTGLHLLVTKGTPQGLVLGDLANDRRPQRARMVARLYGLMRGVAPLLGLSREDAALALAVAAKAAEVQGFTEGWVPEEAVEQFQTRARLLAETLGPDDKTSLAAAFEDAPRDPEAFRAWFDGALTSALRMAAVAVGEPSALSELLPKGSSERSAEIAGEIGAFVVSTEFVRLRSALGLEAS